MTRELASTLDLIDAELAWLGRCRTGQPVHVRNRSISSILRIPADPSPVWFKQVPALFAHEGQAIQWIANLAPGIVPEVLAWGHGWMMTSEMPHERESPEDYPLGVMARLQISTIGKMGRTAGSDAPNLPSLSLGGLIAELEPLARRTDILPARDARATDSSLGRLELACRCIEKLEVPQTLVHGDFHSGNTRWTGRSWMIFDWTDSCIGFPFIDVAQPLAMAGGDPAIAASYRAAWTAVISASEVDKALAAAPAIGAAYHAVMHRRIIDSVPDPASYTQALLMWVRRMVTALDS